MQMEKAGRAAVSPSLTALRRCLGHDCPGTLRHHLVQSGEAEVNFPRSPCHCCLLNLHKQISKQTNKKSRKIRKSVIIESHEHHHQIYIKAYSIILWQRFSSLLDISLMFHFYSNFYLIRFYFSVRYILTS